MAPAIGRGHFATQSRDESAEPSSAQNWGFAFAFERLVVALAGAPVWVVDDGEEFLLAVAANAPEWQHEDSASNIPTSMGSRREARRSRRQNGLPNVWCSRSASFLRSGSATTYKAWGGTSRGDRQRLLRRGVTAELVEHGVHARARDDGRFL
jgi:hypothetical protein